MVRKSSIFLVLTVFLAVMNGIARASLEMKLSPVLREGYDNNILLLNNNKDKKYYGIRSKGDFINSTGLLFGLDQSSFYLKSLLNYYIESQNFSKNEQFNNVGHNAFLQLDIFPSNVLSFDVKNLFRLTEDFDFTITGLESRESPAIERQKKYVDDFYVRANYQITGKNILYLDYKRYLDNVETIRELDENINSFRIGLDSLYGRMNKNKLSLMFEVKNYNFKKNRQDGVYYYTFEGQDKGFETYSFIVASLWDLSDKSNLRAYGGALRTEDDNQDSLIKEEGYFTGGLAYKKEFNYALINLSYDHEISGSRGFGELVQRRGIRLNGTAFFNSYFSATLSSNFKKNNFRDNYYSDPKVSNSKNDNKTLSFLADLSYDNKVKFKATLYYSFFKNDYLIPKEAGIADYKQSTIALKTNYSILKYWVLKIEYNYTWRDTIDNDVGLPDLFFRRSLISIGIEYNKFDFR
ncbi:MAG: hypothetical protein ACMUIU_09340 [bacterium]